MEGAPSCGQELLWLRKKVMLSAAATAKGAHRITQSRDHQPASVGRGAMWSCEDGRSGPPNEIMSGLVGGQLVSMKRCDLSSIDRLSHRTPIESS